MASTRCWSLLIGSRRLARPGGTFRAADDRRLREITRRHFPAGYTIIHAAGAWFDPERGRFVREQSRQVLIAGANLPAVCRWARELGAALAQRELLLVEVGRAIRLRIGARR